MTDIISHITEEEEQLYDRQIRLWGMEAQTRLKNAKVLMIGVNGVSCDIIKNLVLTGINKIALSDELNVSEEDITNNFLISRNSVGENRAMAAKLRTQNLNPRVIVDVYDHLPIEIDKQSSDGVLSISDFDIVVCCVSHAQCHGSSDLWSTINEVCRQHGKLFFAMDTFGWHGVTFMDLGTHRFVKEEHQVQKPGEKAADSALKMSEHVKQFCPFNDVLAIDWSGADHTKRLKRMPKSQFAMLAVQQFVAQFRRALADTDEEAMMRAWATFAELHGLSSDLVVWATFLECTGAGHMPANAVLGGLVTQEIIKAISGKNEPVGNFVLFNGISCSADSTFVAD